MFLWDWLKKLGSVIRRAFGYAEEAGLTNGLVETALRLVREAAEKFATNEQRREWVVATLRALGVSERIARLALELAIVIWKRDG